MRSRNAVPIGGSMSFRLLNAYQTIAAIDGLIKDAQSEVVIVSPYFKMERTASLMRTLRLALERKRRVTMLIREDSSNVASDVLEEFVDLGMKLQAVPNLHAKLYWSDAGAVVSSINMLTTSFESSIEAGLEAQDEQARRQVQEFIQREVQPRNDIGRSRPSPASSKHRQPEAPSKRSQPEQRERKARKHDEGFCIRCCADLPVNIERPLCSDCYESWAKYEDDDYPEKFCHLCGEKNATSKRKPLCEDCY